MEPPVPLSIFSIAAFSLKIVTSRDETVASSTKKLHGGVVVQSLHKKDIKKKKTRNLNRKLKGKKLEKKKTISNKM